MNIELSLLRNNPMRDMSVDPIDDNDLPDAPSAITKLRQSINDHGYWGGVVARKAPDGNGYEIACGHHRVEAARREGISHGEVTVMDLTDQKMLVIYAIENATQRGQSSTSTVGTVAAAIRWLAEDAMGMHDGLKNSSTRKPLNPEAISQGIGRSQITEYLKSRNVPGYNEWKVENALANLGGRRADIIHAVFDRFEDWKAARAAELEAERKAAEAAEDDERVEEIEEEESEIEAIEAAAEKLVKVSESKRDDSFDLEGVSALIKVPDQLDTFRKLVQSPAIKEILPKEQQVELARHIIKEAKERGKQMTAGFIREIAHDAVKVFKGDLKKAKKKRLAEQSWEDKYIRAQKEFVSKIKAVGLAGAKISDLERERPKGVTVGLSHETQIALEKLDGLAKACQSWMTGSR